MKKRNLNSKKLRMLSVGLLTSGAVLSVKDVQPIVAKELDQKVTDESDEQEKVAILSSTKEHETTESTVEGSTASTSVETSTSTTSSEASTTEETDTTSETTSSTSTQETTDSTSTSVSDSTTDTTTSSTSSSSTTSTSTTTTTSSKPKPVKPKPVKPKPKPTPVPSKPAPQRPSVPQSDRPSVGTSHNNVGNHSISDQPIHISPNLTTKGFVKVIGEDARTIAGENNLYASVMIAQAILESASGNSALAAAPNYNLFGIKGSYKGASANFLTSEDNGSGSMFTIRSDFRKYPSYKESLGDYVKLLRGGTDFSDSFYSGTWKTNTKSYRDATKFLTGRYATDTSYASKLNGLIDAYDLTQYDTLKDKKSSKKAKKITLNTSFDKVSKRNEQEEKNAEFLTHIVEKGESLKSISELYDLSTLAILEKNQLDRRMIYIGQKLSIPKQEEKTTLLEKEDAVDRSLEMVQKLSNTFKTKETQVKTETTKKATQESSEKSTSTSMPAKKEAKDYQVSATRKKTKETYEVKKGDTLASISKKTGISIWSLKEWNDLDQYFLTEGQRLVLTPVYDLQS